MTQLAMETKMLLAKRIEKNRREKKLTQGALGQLVGVTASMISQIESGKANASYGLLSRMADVFGITVSDLTQDTTQKLSQDVRMKIAQCLVEQKEYDKSLKLYDEMLQDESFPVQLTNQLKLKKAEVLYVSGDGHMALQELNFLIHEASNETATFMAYVYNLVGKVYFKMNDHLNSYLNFQHALTKAEIAVENDLTTGEILYNIGNCLELQGKSSEASNYFERADKVMSALSMSAPDVAQLYYSIGVNYSHSNNLSKAAEYLERAVTLYSTIRDVAMMVKVKGTIAYHVVSKNDFEQANKILVQCCEELCENGEYLHLAYTRSKLIELCIDNSAMESADHYFSVFDEELGLYGLNPCDEMVWGYIFRVKAKYASATGLMDDAVEWAYRSQQIYEKIGLEKEAAKSLEIVMGVEESRNNTESAYKISKRIVVLLSAS